MGLAQLARLLIRPHTRVTLLIFLLLENPAMADFLDQIPQCLWPTWCVDLRRQHGLRSITCKRILAMLAFALRTDVVPAELGHVFVRQFTNMEHRPTTVAWRSSGCCAPSRLSLTSSWCSSDL